MGLICLGEPHKAHSQTQVLSILEIICQEGLSFFTYLKNEAYLPTYIAHRKPQHHEDGQDSKLKDTFDKYKGL